MNKKAGLILLAVVILGAGFLFFINGKKASNFTSQVTGAEQSQQVDPSTQVSIDISSFAFKSNIVKVKKGTTITWTNRDNAPHTVTSDEGSYLDSSVLNKNGVYSKTFDTTGTYRYHCTPHPQMLGAVIVTD